MKILVTGVHSTPAFAVIDELLSRKDYDIYYVGQKHTILFDKNLSAEYKVAQTKKIKFIDFFAGKLSRTLTFSSLIWWLRLPIGYIQALFLIMTIRPKVILTFGSHVGVPIATMGWLFKIPVISHEQTMIVARAMKVIMKFARVNCYSWAAQKDHYGKDAVFSGNPIRKEVFQNNIKIEFADNTKKNILFMCGNQGAHVINEAVEHGIKELSSKYNVVLQAGKSSIINDYERLSAIAEEINKDGVKFIVKDYIFPNEVGSYYNSADLVIGRCGANQTYEYVALGKVVLCIPLPSTVGNDQYTNAKLLKSAGTADILDQDNLSGKTLVESIDNIFANISTYSSNLQSAKALVKLDAEKIISDLAEKYIGLR